MGSVFFKRWSNKKYAVLSSFHKEICIGTLALSCIILQIQPVLAQSDTTSPVLFYDLEEVESLSNDEAEIYAPQLRQLLLLNQDQLNQSTSRSLAEFLDYYPGLDLRTRGANGIQSDLNIQGGSFDQSLVLLNGVNISDPQTGHFNLDLPLSISQINKVEVLKGPSSKKYGFAAYSGAINIITQPSDSAKVNAELSYGQFSTLNTYGTINIPFGIIKTMISANYSESMGYQENTDYGNTGIFLHSVAEGKGIISDLIFGWNEKSFGANAFYTPRFPEQYEETNSMMSIFKLETKHSRIKTEGNLSWKRHHDHFLLFRSDPSAYENYHLTDVLGASLSHRLSSAIGLSSLSMKYRYEQIYSTTLGERIPDPVRVKNSPEAYYNRSKTRQLITLSAEHTLAIGRFYINAGMLLNSGIEELLNPGIYPGLDLSYRIDNNFTFFASANRSSRLPTFTDLYYQGPQNMGNPDLVPEKAATYESGLKYSGAFLNADIGLFYRFGKETIDWIWEDSIWHTQNLAELNTYGGETSFTFYPKKISSELQFIDYLRISYNYIEISKADDSYISNYALDNLKHKFIIDLNLKFPLGFYLGSKIRWQDRNGSFLYYENPASVPYETDYSPYWLVDIDVGLNLKRITFYVSATNLLDQAYRDIGSVGMPGRWIITGIKFR